MINLDIYKKATIKLSKSEEFSGYYNTETDMFYDDAEFINMLKKSHKELEGKNNDLKREIERQKKTIKFERQKNNEKFDEVRKEAEDAAVSRVCELIQSKYDLYKAEPMMIDLTLGYSDIIDLLKNMRLWR